MLIDVRSCLAPLGSPTKSLELPLCALLVCHQNGPKSQKYSSPGTQCVQALYHRLGHREGLLLGISLPSNNFGVPAADKPCGSVSSG